MTADEQMKYKYRGMVLPEKVIASIKACDYGFVHTQKLGYYFSYETNTFQFHVVDRFASFPLFYCIKDGKPYVSENVEDLIPQLDRIEFDPAGYYSSGGLFKGERTELTPFKGIKRIKPGHYLEYKSGHINIVQYWSFLDLKDKPFNGTIDEAAEKLGFLINQAVKRCYDFDKNCAVHLSGGLDSGIVASLYASFSDDNVQAYLKKFEDDPMVEGTESSYAKKYQVCYPNLKLECFDYKSPSLNSEFLAGNWHTARLNSNEGLEITHAAKNDHKFILTGLGGDELASYKISKLTKRLIGNDRQANELIKFRNRPSTKIKEIIKILLGKKGNPIHALKLYSPQNFFSSNHFWYTKEFYKKNKYLMDLPPMIPEAYPTTLSYRLEVLSRSWFTIRSDRWNYLGAKHGIDFIHPLLDADLISFAACIPASMYMDIGKRELFKKACNKYIPSDLLEGVKRKMNSPNMPNAKLLEQNLSIQLTKTYDLEQSIASSVFDIKVLRKQIKCSIKKLYSAQKYNKNEAIGKLQFHLFVYNTILSYCAYINVHFHSSS